MNTISGPTLTALSRSLQTLKKNGVEVPRTETELEAAYLLTHMSLATGGGVQARFANLDVSATFTERKTTKVPKLSPQEIDAKRTMRMTAERLIKAAAIIETAHKVIDATPGEDPFACSDLTEIHKNGLQAIHSLAAHHARFEINSAGSVPKVWWRRDAWDAGPEYEPIQYSVKIPNDPSGYAHLLLRADDIGGFPNSDVKVICGDHPMTVYDISQLVDMARVLAEPGTPAS